MAKRILNVAVAEAFDAVGAGENIAVADGILEIYADLSASSVSLLGDPVRAQDVLEFNETAHAAGTAQVSAIIFAGTVVADTAYRIVLKYNGLEDSFGMKTYAVIPAAQTIASLRDAFVTAINNDTSSLITAAAVGGDEISLTQNAADSMEGFSILDESALGDSDPTATATVEVAYAAPVDFVAEYPNLTFAGTNYTAFDFEVRKYVGEQFGGNASYVDGVYRILANEGGANFGTFQTEMQELLDGLLS